jgi:diguanylate cyclase (GGDEF)-like protein
VHGPSGRWLAGIAAGLIAAWVVVAAVAALTGVVPLAAGAGLSLAAGALLTAGLVAAVTRLPGAIQMSRPALATAASAAGVAWSLAYLVAGGGLHAPATAMIAMGMTASALLLSLPVVTRATLAALAAGAVIGQALLPGLLAMTGLVDLPTAWPSALPLAAQALVAGSICVAGHLLAEESQRRDLQQEQLTGSLRRATYQAERDQLTSSYNRRHIIEMLAKEMARSDRTDTPFCVCLLDLDHFKALNDRHGHLAGDRTLASFARRVRGELRTMDSINHAGVPSALGRVGGEEFLVLLPDTTLRGALQVAERIRQCVNQRPLDGRHEVTVSIGMAEYRGSETVGSLLGRADKALYGAKRAGRNRVHAASREGSSAAIVMPQIPRAS